MKEALENQVEGPQAFLLTFQEKCPSHSDDYCCFLAASGFSFSKLASKSLSASSTAE